MREKRAGGGAWPRAGGGRREWPRWEYEEESNDRTRSYFGYERIGIGRKLIGGQMEIAEVQRRKGWDDSGH